MKILWNSLKKKITALKTILAKNEEIIAKERDIKTSEILIKKAEIEAKKLEYEGLERSKENYRLNLSSEENREATLSSSLQNERDRLTNLQVALGQNQTAQLIKDIKHRVEILEKDKVIAEAAQRKLQNILDTVAEALSLLSKFEVYILSKDELLKLGPSDQDIEVRS